MSNTNVVVTGVSSGIGYAIAKELVSHDIKVFVSVRNEKDALRVANDLGALFTPLIFDITDEIAVRKAAQQVKDRLQGQKLSCLINNAGVVVVGSLIETPLHEFRHQLEVNVIGQILVTQAFVPLLGADKALKGDPGKIINISSVAGKLFRPFLGPYSISKHGLEAFSDTLRFELMLYGIDVIVIGPGMVNTEIWHKNEDQVSDEKLQQSVYAKPMIKFRNYIYKAVAKSSVPAKKVGELAYHILINSHPKTRYTIVPNRFFDWILPNILPKRFVNNKIAKALGILNDEKN